MRYRPIAIILGFLVMVLADATVSQPLANDISNCNQTKNPERMIESCSRLLNSKRLSRRNRSAAIKNLSVGYLLRGNGYAKKKEYTKAISDFKNALKYNSKNSNARNNLGFVYFNRGIAFHNQGKYHQAIADFDEFIVLSPKDAAAYFNRGFNYEKLGMQKKAAQDYAKAATIDPSHSSAKQGLVRLLGLMQTEKAAPSIPSDKDFADCGQYADLDRTIQGCTRVLTNKGLTKKVRWAAHHSRSTAYFEKRDWDKANADSNQAIKIDPNSADAYFIRGGSSLEKCLQSLFAGVACNYESIVADMSYFLKSHPKHKYALRYRYLAYLGSGQKKEIMAHCVRLAELDSALAKECTEAAK